MSYSDMTYAWFDVTRNAGIARIMHMSYRCKTNTWNNVSLVKRSMIRVFFFNISLPKAGCPLRSSSTLVLPSLNNLHHFLTLNSYYIVPSSYTVTVPMSISLGRKVLAFTAFTTHRNSPTAGFLISCLFFITTANGEKIMRKINGPYKFL